MLLTAIVREVRPSGLLVRDTSNGRTFSSAPRMRAGIVPGDRIVVLFNGVMTNSLPPQINAIFIRRLAGGGPFRPPLRR